MQISVRSNVKQVSKNLTRIQRRQIPFATSVALNRTIDKVRDDEYGSMKKYFDRPTKNVLNYSLKTKHSKKTLLMARLWAVDWANAFLKYQVFGGTETKKDKRLVAPVSRARVNAFGNIKGKRNTLIKRGDYFANTSGGKPGVWKKQGRGKQANPRLMYIFKDRMQYKKRWPFFRVAERSVAKHFPRFFDRAMAKALRTAR